jgi:hypothetical protein
LSGAFLGEGVSATSAVGGFGVIAGSGSLSTRG